MNVFGRWMLYLHTIRYLRPSQVFWRVWRRLPSLTAPDVGPAQAQRECAAVFVRAVQAGGPAPIPCDELAEVSRVAIEAA